MANILTTSEAKNYLRVDLSDDDTLIDNMVTAAQTLCEQYQGMKYLTTTCCDYFDTLYDVMPLSYHPVQSVTSVKYYDTDSTEQTLTDTYYDLYTDKLKGEVRRAYNKTYPTVRGHHNDVTITYVAGYDGAANVPQTIKHAVLLMLSHLYENREIVSYQSISELPMSIKSLLSLDRGLRL